MGQRVNIYSKFKKEDLVKARLKKISLIIYIRPETK